LDHLPGCQPGLDLSQRIWRQVRHEGTTRRWFGSLQKVWSEVGTTIRSWAPNRIKRSCKVT
jgi:hypothetical protein